MRRLGRALERVVVESIKAESRTRNCSCCLPLFLEYVGSGVASVFGLACEVDGVMMGTRALQTGLVLDCLRAVASTYTRELYSYGSKGLSGGAFICDHFAGDIYPSKSRNKRYINTAPLLNCCPNPMVSKICTAALISHSGGQTPASDAFINDRSLAFTHPSQQHQRVPRFLRLHRQAQL